MDDPKELENIKKGITPEEALKMRPPKMHRKDFIQRWTDKGLNESALAYLNKDLDAVIAGEAKVQLAGYSNDNVAKYVTIAVLGSMIHEGKRVTELGFMEFYAAVLNDLEKGSMERSLIEFDNVINRIRANNTPK